MENRFAYVGPATSVEEALERLQSHRGFMAVDTETVNTTDKRIIGIGFAISATEAFYFSAFEDDPESQHYTSPFFFQSLRVLVNQNTKVWFNAGFDLDVIGMLVPGIDQSQWHDVSIMCRIQAMHNSLEMNAGEYLGINHTTIQDILPKGRNMLSLDMPTVAWKCMNDCMVTWQLWDMVKGDRWIEGQEEEGFVWRDVIGQPHDTTARMIRAYRLDRRLIPLLRKMGKKGLKLDHEFLTQAYEKLSRERFTYFDICQKMFGFNPGSNQQAGYVLASRGNFLPWTKNGAYKQFAVDGESLSKIDDPLADIIMEYRTRADKLSDVVEPLLGKPKGPGGQKVPYKDWVPMEYFTTHFRLDLATSRLASSDRNAQNVTPELRKVFMPENGVFTWWDASQIEMRIFAHLTKDPVLRQAYVDNESIHLMTMKELFPGQPKLTCCRQDRCVCGKEEENPLYTTSKTFNFAMIYNAKPQTLALHTRRPVDVCTVLRRRWLDRYPNTESAMKEMEDDGIYRGWVETLEGRRLRIPDLAFRGEEHARTCCINYRVQGSASWPVKLALLDGDTRGFDQRIQVHDEVVMDGDYYEEIPRDVYRQLMGELQTPVDVKRSTRWS